MGHKPSRNKNVGATGFVLNLPDAYGIRGAGRPLIRPVGHRMIGRTRASLRRIAIGMPRVPLWADSGESRPSDLHK